MGKSEEKSDKGKSGGKKPDDKKRKSDSPAPTPGSLTKKSKKEKKSKNKKKDEAEDSDSEGGTTLSIRTKKDKSVPDDESQATRDTGLSSKAAGKRPMRDPPKKEATTTRLDKSTAQRLTESGKVAFVNLPKSVTKNRNTAFSNAHGFIAGLNLVGLTELVASGASYYAAVFDTTANRDTAINTIGSRDMSLDNKTRVRLVCQPFGTKRAADVTIWSIAIGPGGSVSGVLGALRSHLHQMDKSFSSEIQLAQQLRSNIPAGVWWVLFKDPPPGFSKQMGYEGGKVLVTHETAHCRLCNGAGHNAFQCPGNAEKTLASAKNRPELFLATRIEGAQEKGGDEMETEESL